VCLSVGLGLVARLRPKSLPSSHEALLGRLATSGDGLLLSSPRTYEPQSRNLRTSQHQVKHHQVRSILLTSCGQSFFPCPGELPRDTLLMFTAAFPDILLSMPPQRVNSKQRTISWGNTSTPTRQTPSCSSRTLIQSYSQLERREVSIQNPPKTPKTPAARTQVQDDGDIEMANGEEDQGGASDSTISSDDEAQPIETPTRCGIIVGFLAS
jgi:hypothetical protein